MRMVKFMLPLVLALIVCAGAQAEEKHKDGGHWIGALSAKGADAKEGVVGVLTIAPHGKDKGEAKKVNLLGDADIAKQVEALIGKTVEVKGAETPDGVKVASIAEAKHKEKKEK